MIVSDTAVKKSTTVVVLTVILCLFGVYSYLRIPKESDPSITIPNVFISTEYRGVSPVDIETVITVEIEKKLKGLDGIKRIESMSLEGLSLIDVEFMVGTDIKQALLDVKDRVDDAMSELPADLENDPEIFEVNFAEMPIVIYSLSGTCGRPYLKTIADKLKDDIETVPGVLEVEVTGGREREIRIEVLPEKLAYYSLDISNLEHIVESENLNTSGGTVRVGRERYQMQVPGELHSLEHIQALVVGIHEGHPVYLKDVARVTDGFKEETSRSRLDGRSAVNISVKKRSGENIIGISRAVDELVEQHQFHWPAGTEIKKVMDESRDIELMIIDLENNILSGLILVLVVIFFAMGLRNALIVSLSIPFSMLISFTVLYQIGITLNMVVLFSLTLALGMLVDNGIVIVENIYRFMEQGVSRTEAAARATSEVAAPVICSTITTLAAFSPLLFWPDTMGEFMRYIPITLIVTLSASLFVGIVINPAIASLIMRVKGAKGDQDGLGEGQYDNRFKDSGVPRSRFGRTVRSCYSTVLAGALERPVTVIMIAFLLLVLMCQGWLFRTGLENPVEFFPTIDPESMYVNIDVPEGAGLDYIDRLIERVEWALGGFSPGGGGDIVTPPPAALSLAPKEHRKPNGDIYYGPSDLGNIMNIYTRAVAKSEGGSEFEDNTPSHVGVRFMELADRRRSTQDTINEIRERIGTIPGAAITIGIEEEGPPTGEPISIVITGNDFRILEEISRSVKNYLGQIPHIRDVRDSLVKESPSVRIEIDRQKAALFGLTSQYIGSGLKNSYNGIEVSTYRENNKDYNITVQFGSSDRQATGTLRSLVLSTPSGISVPLSTIADIKYSGTIGTITRINHKRVVTIEADVDETRVSSSVVRDRIQELLEEMHLPAGYEILFDGEAEEEEVSQDFLVAAFLAALLLIFLILVSMFNSIVQPFIVMTSVILSLGGVFLGLMIFDASFGIIMTGVGVISLAGVVVNNGIVLVDYTNKLRIQGYSLRDAVITAGGTRFRPVLLTAITTMLGLVPMVTGVTFDFHSWSFSTASEASQWWRSMAIAVIFGLLVSTFFTLVVVPALYCLLEQITDGMKVRVTRMQRFFWKPNLRLAAGGADDGDKK